MLLRLFPGEATAAGFQQPPEASEVGIGGVGSSPRFSKVRFGARADVARAGTELVPH